ncbi:transporter substrate-binding domain-containing protein [Duganella sp. LX20W]|uniref:Transporter substrate-binding domain-containing protein n=1 Tax=Rugamonas brunnea TaxID=2758569 RepID=A0A7W2EN54_9BURK|nr:transporter substrate-binding domain-containing protein [Rugamonas brunnea]MBA5635566.1 transporter substrate-binding domain-containing protein [Rugamonas brunnea]
MHRILSAALLTLAAASTPAMADSYHCVSLAYPPLIQQDASGPAHGLAVDVVRAVFARLGHDMTVEVMPWARSLTMVRLGQRDCVFTIFQTPEREEYLDFSKESIIPQLIYFYARKDAGVAFNGDLGTLAGRRVGTVMKVNYGEKFDAARDHFTVQEVATLEQNFRKLVLGRVDLVPSNVYTASYTLANMHDTAVDAEVVQLPVPRDNVASHIAFAKRRQLTALRDQFDKELKAYVASGAYRHLLEQYRIAITPEMAQFLDHN